MPFAAMSSFGLTEPEIRSMVRSVRRYHIASVQDRNPVIAFLHNAYAVGIMDMLRNLAEDDEIMQSVGIDIRRLRRDVLKVQDSLERKAMKIAETVGLDKLMEKS